MRGRVVRVERVEREVEGGEMGDSRPGVDTPHLPRAAGVATAGRGGRVTRLTAALLPMVDSPVSARVLMYPQEAARPVGEEVREQWR